MDHLSILAISESGMDFQRLRLEAIASNLANADVTRTANGALYKPLEAIAQTGHTPFDDALLGVERMSLVEQDVAPRLIFEPGHPDADATGFIQKPGVNPVDQMVDMLGATRAYEANVRAMNAAKAMLSAALEIGSNK